ncbi:Creatinase/aminopeptidase [Atractiella rhizophila]|nr:Creatinase/aminopeptidase [Atractiella rhizophila]
MVVPQMARAPTSTTKRLIDLRRALNEEKLDAYVVTANDAHGSEFPNDADKRLAFISGFTGSGFALITRWSAYLFAGGFYFSQAKSELDENWVLIEVNARQTDWSHWLLENAEEWRVGMDANLFPYLYLNNIVDTLKKKNIDVILDEKNLIDQVWAERPLKSKKKIYLQELQYSGKASAQKLFDLHIAWLLNLRGSGDIPYSPLFYAHFIISPTESTLFLDEEKIDRKIRNYLDALNVRTRPYEEIAQGFGELKSKTVFSGTDLSYALAKIAKEIPGVELRFVASPVTAAKAVKNKQEIEGFRAGYLRDAASWARWAGWLEEAIRSHEKINEYEAGARLDAYRALQDKFVSLGGSSISATGRNAAFPFYSPSLQSQGDVLDKISPYLNDSGAQYLDSTTDTTRTMHFGKPSQEVKRAFTRVLQGHIAVDSAVFPEGVTGFQLDILERTKLWQDGLDYPHGSGHGVGNFNSSHEGPIGIGKSRAWDSVPLQAGHTITNEPGYYLENHFGIRLESHLLCVETGRTTSLGQKLLSFERFTLVPIDPRLVDFSLLTRFERQWLKRHNQLCYARVSPHLGEDKRAKKWLKRHTKSPWRFPWCD